MLERFLKRTPQLDERTEEVERLYSMLCFVQREIARWEQIFNVAVEDAFIDNSIFMLKSLRAQQQLLVQCIRRLEGVGTSEQQQKNGKEEATAVSGQQDKKEGLIMG